jgi:hypothetical protein
LWFDRNRCRLYRRRREKPASRQILAWTCMMLSVPASGIAPCCLGTCATLGKVSSRKLSKRTSTQSAKSPQTTNTPPPTIQYNHGCFQKDSEIWRYQAYHRPTRCATSASRQARHRRKEKGYRGNDSPGSPGFLVTLLPIQHCARSSILCPHRYKLPLAYSPAQASSS